jgi:hypothetical protein
MTFRGFAICAFVVVLTGCATAPALQTRSGRPEVTVHDRTVQQVRTAVMNHFVDRGWSPVQTEGTQLVFEHEGSAGQSFLMGLMTDNPQSKNRLAITLIENGPDVRLLGGIAVVGANNFGRAQVVELSGKGYQQLQGELQRIKAQVESP